jgi:hypothetical protein
MMRNFKYEIKKSLIDGKQVYVLYKGELNIFVGKSYYEASDLISVDGIDYSDEEILKNIEAFQLRNKQTQQDQLNEIYVKPAMGVDYYLVGLIFLSIIGFVLSISFSQNLLGFIQSTIILVSILVILGAILGSRKRERFLMDRVDALEKKVITINADKITQKVSN